MSLNSAYLNQAECHISRSYFIYLGNSTPIKWELTIYDTDRSRAKFENENAMALLGKQETTDGLLHLWAILVSKNVMPLLGRSRDSCPSMAPLSHVELTKCKNLQKAKTKAKT